MVMPVNLSVKRCLKVNSLCHKQLLSMCGQGMQQSAITCACVIQATNRLRANEGVLVKLGVNNKRVSLCSAVSLLTASI